MKKKMTINTKKFMRKANLFANELDDGMIVYVSDLENGLKESEVKSKKKKIKKSELKCGIELIKTLMDRKNK